MFSASNPVKRTYSRQNRSFTATSSPPRPKKRSRENDTEDKPVKRTKLTKPKPKKLTQLHLALGDTQTALRTCHLCLLSYTRGTPDDESLHRSHCLRVQRGMEWGKDEERDRERTRIETIEDGISLMDGRKGRIVCVPLGNTVGKLAAKMTALLSTINLALSSPALTQEMLQASKAYIFLLTTPTREKIAGCVIAQHITTAFDIDPSSTSISLQTTPRPTPLGISRLFVPSTYRRSGIATLLLDAAANTFIHGCPLDPAQGQVAFTQPTESGEAVMRKWGKDGCRVYEE